MILVDDRSGSKDLVKLLDNAILATLDSGDVAFTGNGPDGPVQIGIERKTTGDLVNSIVSGRLSGFQLPKMLEQYDRVYLFHEGVVREDMYGAVSQLRGTRWKQLTRGTRRFSNESLYGYLNTLEEFAGVLVRSTADLAATANHVGYLYRWWSKPYKDHRSLNQIYRRPIPIVGFIRPSLLRMFANDLPHIGVDMSAKVERHFKTIEAMMGASIEEWMEVQGIGKGIAKQIWGELHGKEKK